MAINSNAHQTSTGTLIPGGPSTANSTLPIQRGQGRGALSNPPGRFESTEKHLDTETLDQLLRDAESQDAANDIPRLRTELRVDPSRSIIARNRSPDVPFEQSINPYRGCEHGCVYCFARPGHSYLGLSPGLDFETRILCKPAAPQLLERELARPGYRCKTIALGTNTDPYQPVERRLGITRGILEVLLKHRHPVSILTKSSAIVRDIDLLSELAERGLVSVYFSLPTLNDALKRSLEPRASAPRARLRAMHALSSCGVPTGVMVAPIIPALTDHEIENVLRRAAHAGARSAGYVLLRLPHEVSGLFKEWLQHHYPERYDRVMNRLREMHGGLEYDSRFGVRQRGQGAWAKLLAARFEAACARLHLNRDRSEPCSQQFTPPVDQDEDLARQGDLFAA